VRRLPALLALPVALALAVGSLPTAALAKQARIFSGSFGAASSVPANPYPLAEPSGVAVDEASGDVYVGDPYNRRVEKFGPFGELLLMFGKEVNKSAVEEHRPIEEQNVCPAVGHPGDTCQTGTVGTSPGAFEGQVGQGEVPILYVAVDNSSGPSSGDVYASERVSESQRKNIVSNVQKFDSSGRLLSSWADEGQLDGSSIISPPAPYPGPLGELNGIAVDSTGNLWVAGTVFNPGSISSQLFKFNQESSLITDLRPARGIGPGGFAIGPENNLYLAGVSKLDSAGNEIGTVTEGLSNSSLATDASGDLYVDGRPYPNGNEFVQRFDASCRPFGGLKECTPVESFGSARLSNGSGLDGIAVDSSVPAKTVYVVDALGGQVVSFSVATVPNASTAKPSGLTASSATLNGTVDPAGVALDEGLEGCRFEWGATAAYGHLAACDKSAVQIGSGTSPVEVHASIGALAPGVTYHFRLVAGNANDVNARVNEPSQGQDVVFGPPTIDSESVSGVASTSATLEAEVNPQNADTHARFEYLTEAEYRENGDSFSGAHPAIAVPEEEADLGSGETGLGLLVHVQGLLPGTVYRYRTVVHSVLGSLGGAVMTFTTQGSNGPLALMDGREWELVSPPDKHGALIEAINQGGLANGGLIQSSGAGNAVTYVTDAPTESGAAGYANGVQVLSIRRPGGWGSHDIAAPHEAATDGSVGFGQEYRFFSTDLSAGILQPFGAFTPALSPEASEQTPYLRSSYSPSDPGEACTSSCYRPLVSGCPPVGQACPLAVEQHADVPPGTVFGNEEFSGKTYFCPPEPRCGPLFVGATPDAGHVVFESRVALTGIPGGTGGLYEWTAGRLALVSVLPDGKPTGGSLGSGEADARHAISDTGSRVIFTGSNNHLYLRVNAAQEQSSVQAGRCTEPARACTLQLDAVKSGGGTGLEKPTYWTASSDGSRVFFTDPQQLTAGSGANGADLYECEIVEEAGNPHCALTDLTPSSAGESAMVQGVSDASEDGSYVYFVADGALTGGERNANGETATGGKANLYVRHGASTIFIATLSSGDSPDWASSLVKLTARVSPSGHWLGFMSDRSLTGYDNRDVVSGKPDEEVYLYHAPLEGSQSELVCASCDPTGARPHGVEVRKLKQEKGIATGDAEWVDETWLAANVPGYTRIAVTRALYQSRYLSDSGRLFFNSSDALVSQDVNGSEDVYEYEPAAVGDCTASSPAYRQASSGCLNLISSGASPKESAFLDASENGNDVFFLTFAQLSKPDVDGALDVYDAHACTAESPCAPASPPPPPACEGDACQSPASIPDDPTPGSLTFRAPGSLLAAAPALVRPKAATQSKREKLARALKACGKKPKRKRAACEQRARHANRATNRAMTSHTTHNAQASRGRSGR
jgi:hypothetical protein